MEDQLTCPVCTSELVEQSTRERIILSEKHLFNCPRCGKYILTRSVLDHLSRRLDNPGKIALLSHSIYKMQRENDIPVLDSYLIEQVLETQLPSLSDQMKNLILWLGDNFEPGQKIVKKLEIFQTIMGAKKPDGAHFILDHLNARFIHLEGDYKLPRIQLTMPGWEYYDDLKRGAIMSRRAFMAMKFGNEDLDTIFANHFKPAVKATGFDLYRLDEQPRAGLIDDRLRVEIRTSRFLISDLTHENPGAYWEAGYAEGLGKSVVYTCEKSKFETQKTHFDTNHHLTIIWDKENLEEATRQLKATIRATLPDEAILTDSQ